MVWEARVWSVSIIRRVPGIEHLVTLRSTCVGKVLAYFVWVKLRTRSLSAALQGLCPAL